jgi:hypothetical protein
LTIWYQHGYPPDALAIWVERIRTSGCKRVWVHFNNDREGHAIRNAKELTRELKCAFAGMALVYFSVPLSFFSCFTSTRMIERVASDDYVV